MPALEMMRGPALASVAPDDAEALRHLAREQHARLATIREEKIWSWLGGEFAGLKHLWPFMSQYVFMGMVLVTMLVAGFTQGVVLWIFLALTALSVLPYWLIFVPNRARTLDFYRTGEQRPAFVVAVAPELEDPDEEEAHAAHVLVGPALGDPAQLQAQAALAARIAAALNGSDEAAAPDLLPGDAQPFLAELRRRIEAGVEDGSRTPVPPTLGAGFEVAHVPLFLTFLPDEHLISRLLFVLAAPDRRGAGSTKVVQSAVWGEGAGSLCAAFPREVTR